VAGTPGTEGTHRFDKLLPSFRQGVCDLGWYCGLDVATNDAVGFKLAELRCQHLFTDAHEKSAEFSEALRFESQMPDDDYFPFTADDINGGLYGTAVMILHLRLQAYLKVRTSASHSTVISSDQRAGRRRKTMILITGSNGTVGKAVLAVLAGSGERHRAMYRSEEDAVRAPAGTETVVGDFSDKASLASALRGIHSVYLVCSPIPDLVKLEVNAIEACEAAGVRRTVLNSALGAGEYGKSFPSWHRKVEDKLRATRMSYCILRPNSFMQNVVTFYAPSIRAQGAFYSSMGSARTSYLDVRDIAAVAAKALCGGEHDGKTYELNGPEALTCADVAEKISKQAGVPAQYVDISVDAQRKGMLDQGMPEWQVTALLDLQEYYRGGYGGVVDNLLRRLSGRNPMCMDQFLAEYAAEFRTQTASA
jgi:uncharacterized protein YbjT (DUF2867 family)